MQKKHVLTGIFLLSLLANAFFIGLIAGQRPMPPFDRPHHPEPPFMRLKTAARDLPVDQRAIVDQIVDQQAPTDIDTLVPLFEQLKDVMTAPHFDRAALETIHKQIGEKDREMKNAMESMALTLGEKLTPEARIQLFSKMFADDPGGKFKKDPRGTTEKDSPPVE